MTKIFRCFSYFYDQNFSMFFLFFFIFETSSDCGLTVLETDIFRK